ncbi:MAG: hypothetical protein Q9205_007672 [Flavoplaca limonia]
MAKPTDNGMGADCTRFPFENLPLELKFQVIRFAMPPQGLLPRPLPDPKDHEDWNQYEKNFFLDYEKQLQTKDLSTAVIPVSLFQVNKFFAAEAYSIFLKDIYLVIRIDRQRTHFLTTMIHKFTNFKSYHEYTHVPHFKRMRNFRIDFEYDPWWTDVQYGKNFSPKYGMDLATCRFTLKEKLRTICDLLAENNNIQRLTVKVPCLCNCIKVASVEHGKSVILETLQPLKRLSVVENVVFGTRHDPDHCEDTHCDQTLCDDLIVALVADVGRLTGEELSEPEVAWKYIKTLPRVQSEPIVTKVEDKMEALWDAINSSPDYIELIRGLRTRTERYMLRQSQRERGDW